MFNFCIPRHNEVGIEITALVNHFNITTSKEASTLIIPESLKGVTEPLSSILRWGIAA
jgi:hypothetical protein